MEKISVCVSIKIVLLTQQKWLKFYLFLQTEFFHLSFASIFTVNNMFPFELYFLVMIPYKRLK